MYVMMVKILQTTIGRQEVASMSTKHLSMSSVNSLTSPTLPYYSMLNKFLIIQGALILYRKLDV